MSFLRRFLFMLLFGASAFAQDSPGKIDLDQYAQKGLLEINQLWQTKSYDSALVILRDLYNTPDMNQAKYAWTSILYNMTCAHSLLGNSDSALIYLDKTVDAGYQNYKHLLSDSDLDPLRNDTQFKKLLLLVKRASEFWDGPAIATPYREDLPVEEKLAGLAKLWMEVKLNFVYFDQVPDLNWDSVYVAYIPRVQQTTSTLEYFRMLQQMTALLRDGHTGLTPPRELWSVVWASPDISTRLVGDKVIITKVGADSLKSLGVRAGIEVTAIDGTPTLEYAKQYVMPYMSASTPQGLNVQTYRYYLLNGPVDKPVQLTLLDDKNRVSTATLPRTQEFSGAPIVNYRKVPGDISYVEFTTFSSDSAVTIFDSLFDRVAQSKGLIIDVRRNGGGNSSVGWKILGYLTDTSFATLKTETRTYSPQARVEGRAQQLNVSTWTAEANGTHLFKGPVVVLSSSSTGSAAEDFLVAFRSMHRGVIVGEPSYGSTGQPLTFMLPGGISGRVCTKRCFYPDGSEFVGIGVQPDVRVEATQDDIRKGRDVVLDAGIKYIKENADRK